MAKKFSTVIIIALLFAATGCQPTINPGDSVILPVRETKPPVISDSGYDELEIIDKVTKSRLEYKNAMELLINYYTRSGNNEKRKWAQTELTALNSISQYEYFNPIIVSNTYEPTTTITDADLLWEDAMLLKTQAEGLGQLFVDKNKYRAALNNLRQLILKYPKSDKIDDAAYQIGVISEYFKDYSIALTYYQAAYKWDTYTPYPARFRAARILDKHMHEYADALALYREAIEVEGIYEKNDEWKRNAEERIKQLEKSM